MLTLLTERGGSDRQGRRPAGISSAPCHGTPLWGVFWVRRLCRSRRGQTNGWPPSRLGKAHARLGLPDETRHRNSHYLYTLLLMKLLLPRLVTTEHVV